MFSYLNIYYLKDNIIFKSMIKKQSNNKMSDVVDYEKRDKNG